VRIADILRRCTSDSLVLIDELGTGTDPDEGGALSCAVLMELKRRGALSVVTTHLGALKVFAHSTQGIVNGSMETEILRETESSDTSAGGSVRPTYRLIVGEPGASHAFKIAARLGIAPEVIAEAAGYFTGGGGKVEELISDLRLKRREHEEKIRETESMQAELGRLREMLAGEIAQYKKSRREALLRAHAEAEDILKTAKSHARRAEEILKADARAAAQAVRALEKNIEESRIKRRALLPDVGEALKDAQTGQRVRVAGLGIEGVIISINQTKGRAVVSAQGREVEAPLEELTAVEGGAETTANRDGGQGAEGGPRRAFRRGFGGEPSREVHYEINLIGQRVEPALSELERYLNDAALADLNSVRVIHGFGTGRLSAAIREYLSGHPLARRFEKAPQEAGGDGVTIVYL
jgi:DNA mismatch repair protein MutS2